MGKKIVYLDDAIEAFKPYAEYDSNATNADWCERITTILNRLPSAQLEAIYCKDCQHFRETDNSDLK